MLQFKEIEKLGELLAATLVQIDRVAGLYRHLDRLKDIEQVELQKLISLCDNGTEVADLARWVEYLQKPRTEGRIFMQGNGRYVMDATGIEFTCGRPIEVYNPGGPDRGWHLAGWNMPTGTTATTFSTTPGTTVPCRTECGWPYEVSRAQDEPAPPAERRGRPSAKM